MYKRLSLFTFVALIASSIATPQLQSVCYNASNTIIATDLDDVLLHRKQRKTIFTALKNPRGVRNYYKLKKNNQSTGADLETWYIQAQQRGNRSNARFLRKIASTKGINEDTLIVYKKLHQQGFKFYTATNIGSIFFTDIKRKFPHIFNDRFIKEGMCVDYAATDIIQKPDLRYFELLKKKINPAGDKQIIFIDDKLENVIAARKAGLLAIHFKDADQLRQELRRFNIYV